MSASSFNIPTGAKIYDAEALKALVEPSPKPNAKVLSSEYFKKVSSLDSHERFLKGVEIIIQKRLLDVAELGREADQTIKKKLSDLVNIIRNFHRNRSESSYSRLSLAAVLFFLGKEEEFQNCKTGIFELRENGSDFHYLIKLLDDEEALASEWFFGPLLKVLKEDQRSMMPSSEELGVKV